MRLPELSRRILVLKVGMSINPDMSLVIYEPMISVRIWVNPYLENHTIYIVK